MAKTQHGQFEVLAFDRKTRHPLKLKENCLKSSDAGNIGKMRIPDLGSYFFLRKDEAKSLVEEKAGDLRREEKK